MKLEDLNDLLDLELESEDYDSIGGLIIGQLDRLPEEGESVVCDGIRLVVDRLDKNRIDGCTCIFRRSRTLTRREAAV